VASIYLDNAATTPLDERVAETMRAFLETETFGNPSSIHEFGRRSRAQLEAARDTVAQAIGAQPSEIIFTGGGTEADFLALTGILAGSGHRGRRHCDSRGHLGCGGSRHRSRQCDVGKQRNGCPTTR